MISKNRNKVAKRWSFCVVIKTDHVHIPNNTMLWLTPQQQSNSDTAEGTREHN